MRSFPGAQQLDQRHRHRAHGEGQGERAAEIPSKRPTQQQTDDMFCSLNASYIVFFYFFIVREFRTTQLDLQMFIHPPLKVVPKIPHCPAVFPSYLSTMRKSITSKSGLTRQEILSSSSPDWDLGCY